MKDLNKHKDKISSIIFGESPFIDGSPYNVKGKVQCIGIENTNSLLVKFFNEDMTPFSKQRYDEIWAFECFVLSFIQNKRNFVYEKKR